MLKKSNPIRPPQVAVTAKVPSLSMAGTLRDAATREPLQNLLVRAFYLEPPHSAAAKAPAPRLLGSGTSDNVGRFVIGWDPAPAVAQLLCLLAGCEEAEYKVSVAVPDAQSPLLETAATSAGGKTVNLNLLVPMPAQKLHATQWSDLGSRVAKGGSATLSGVIDQLVRVPAAQSIFADWPVEQRLNAVAQLESAFLDPHNTLGKIMPLPPWRTLEEAGALDAYRSSLGQRGSQPEVKAALDEVAQKLRAFPDVGSVDWPLDFSHFTIPGKAIAAQQNNYYGRIPIDRFPWDVNPEIGYRDYLRAQWTSMITELTSASPKQLTITQAEQQLRNRFHQDFTTVDTTSKPANEVLIPVLVEILTAAPGATFGFGVTPSSIPARGSSLARPYLDTLIGLTHLSTQELNLRYRADFSRPDTAQSNAVWENVYTLQGFFRDSFQAVTDPNHTDPDVLGQPIILDLMMGGAPFFLEFDEWLLLRQPVPFENYFQIRAIFQMNVKADARASLGLVAAESGPSQGLANVFLQALAVNDALEAAYQQFDRGEYQAAIDAFSNLPPIPVPPVLTGFPNGSPEFSGVDIAGNFEQRRAMKIASLDDLNAMLTLWQVGTFDPTDSGALDPYFGAYTAKLACALTYLVTVALPTMSAMASLALGNYADAIRPLGRAISFLVGEATSSDKNAWRDWYENDFGGARNSFPLYSAGDLPYTVQTPPSLKNYPDLGDDDSSEWDPYTSGSPWDDLAAVVVPALHSVESAFYRLRMGDGVLAWADTLYRTDQASSISRARELYKGIYYLHGATPPINPGWVSPPSSFFPFYVNPAKAAQLSRAELGFTQIAAGLNYFGYADDMVPSLRYSTLKSAADAYAAAATSTERDFLNAMSMIESATIDTMKDSAMLQRATSQVQVAQEQAKIAGDQVTQANVQIAQVNQQIAAVTQQISDHDSFVGQFGDYLSGMQSTIKSMGLSGSDAAAAYSAASGGEGSLLGLSGGAAAMSGIGVFAVASYMTFSSMNDADNQRTSQLNNLKTQNLVAANAQLDIAQQNATIAGLQQQIAQSDANLATSLLAYAQDRYLNVEFWSYMAALFQRLFRTYLDMAARTGWLAERALAYEQNKSVNIIGFDYYPAQYQGAGGADELNLDLATLDAQHLAGLQEIVPIKMTYSLARDFPLQFAQLRQTGACLFATSDAALQLAYPGMYGFRVLAATPRLVRSNAGVPMRGVLTNAGVSSISIADGSLQQSIRSSDGMSISDFDISTFDMNVFGLPGATLMQFEGSGIETIWQIVLPASANPGGLSSLGDVLVTFDLRAQFSFPLFATASGSPPTSVSKLVVISAARQGLAGLADLQNSKVNIASLPFDFTALGLPAQEKTRTLNNIFVVLVGASAAPAINIEVISATPAKDISVALKAGVAFSNAPPITDSLSTVPPSPLNALAGIDANQTFALKIDKTANAGVDFTRITDVLLGVDYTAAL